MNGISVILFTRDKKPSSIADVVVDNVLKNSAHLNKYNLKVTANTRNCV